MKRAIRVIISGGGTGGHIFPAVAIANALKRIAPETEILFVGAKGRMEMEKVPAAGYKIVGLDIQGFERKSILKNILLPYKLVKSVLNARSIINAFKPDVAIGVGGYASGPLLLAASQMDIPYLIQEQNSFAGITNKWLGKNAQRICVAFEGMEKFFPAAKIMLTGNPIRKEVVNIDNKRFASAEMLSLSPHKQTILVTGGSLGAGTLNNSFLVGIKKILDADVQLIWQTGKHYFRVVKEKLEGLENNNIRVMEFLHKMELGYAAADVIVSRAGAGTIAELCVIGKPVILVPSPNVTEDHQTQNALALVKNGAAIMISDASAGSELVNAALNLVGNPGKCRLLANNIKKMAFPDADEVIAREVFKLVEQKYGPLI
ncbi:MAG: undecaprenyldiphospho-muramoylpentapeptide beta-N-acetylglucosaminyltransferase [Flavobacterium sp.]|nr:undecaprenyldiphospho-muramoylpentapeptide beta-N-acetylglucosaminyltransferase [Pedobacter sp.]